MYLVLRRLKLNSTPNIGSVLSFRRYESESPVDAVDG